MVQLGIANGRMKDFYDLWVLARTTDFSGAVLAEAIRATFRRRRTEVPGGDPIALTPEFSTDRMKQALWRAFLSRIGREGEPADLEEVCALLRTFLLPPSHAAAASREPFEAGWTAPGPWR